MILQVTKPLPEYARRKIEKCDVDEGTGVRRCPVYIPEEKAVTYIHPESFDFSDVYGECELIQVIMEGKESPVTISKFQFEKNRRSFEQEAAAQIRYMKIISDDVKRMCSDDHII